MWEIYYRKRFITSWLHRILVNYKRKNAFIKRDKNQIFFYNRFFIFLVLSFFPFLLLVFFVYNLFTCFILLVYNYSYKMQIQIKENSLNFQARFQITLYFTCEWILAISSEFPGVSQASLLYDPDPFLAAKCSSINHSVRKKGWRK